VVGTTGLLELGSLLSRGDLPGLSGVNVLLVSLENRRVTDSAWVREVQVADDALSRKLGDELKKRIKKIDTL
jgi:hypothetical protein